MAQIHKIAAAAPHLTKDVRMLAFFATLFSGSNPSRKAIPSLICNLIICFFQIHDACVYFSISCLNI